MSAIDIVIIALAGLAVAGVTAWTIYKKKTGKGGCCDCPYKNGCQSCPSLKNKEKEE